MISGKIHSLQSLGTVDGPGVRFVVFVQGCPLRCKFCHNPDTWDFNAGEEISAEEIVRKVLRYREYFKDSGGITVSGGEPLMQADFVREIFSLCKKEGVNTCLDTSGCVINENVLALLDVTDRVLLDWKFASSEAYRENVGCSKNTVEEFIEILEQMKIPTTLRQVIIPTVNDNFESLTELKKQKMKFSCVDKIELLPFKKICQTKYDQMGIEFPFASVPSPTSEQMKNFNDFINS